MTRKTFLTIASAIAITVGLFAVIFPAILQESKGTLPNKATYVWTIEVGLLLIAMGSILFFVRGHDDSPTIKVLLAGNFIIQLGLLLIELLAYFNDVITKLSGILPNFLLHCLLAFGFFFYMTEVKIKKRRSSR